MVINSQLKQIFCLALHKASRSAPEHAPQQPTTMGGYQKGFPVAFSDAMCPCKSGVFYVCLTLGRFGILVNLACCPFGGDAMFHTPPFVRFSLDLGRIDAQSAYVSLSYHVGSLLGVNFPHQEVTFGALGV